MNTAGQEDDRYAPSDLMHEIFPVAPTGHGADMDEEPVQDHGNQIDQEEDLLNVVRIPDEVDAAAAALTRMRFAAEARGQGRLYGGAAKANLRNFGKAMESRSAAPVRKRDEETDPRQLGGYSGTGASPRDPQGVAGVVERLIAGRGWRTPVAVWSVMERWPSIVGPYVAAHCVPENFEDTVLTVRCSSTAQATNLRLIEPTILQAIAADLGEGIVTRLVVQGPVAPSWKRGPRTVQGRGPRDTYG